MTLKPALMHLAHLLCVALALASGAARAEDLPDPAVCATEDGWLEVATAYYIALVAAHKAGKLTDQQSTDLSVWSVQMDNYLIESNNSKVYCEQLLAVRRAWGF